uniref:Uncharacterized protein n=1 Tax=Tanacetum cinerariifolium TaxID=118510 RepID=A0A6L2KH50_TANCI|nr:hypothetical protein [Tanacetum cinerariifolium]
MIKWDVNWTRSCADVVAFACVILSCLVEAFARGFRCGMSFGVATLRAVVHAGDKISEDARSCADRPAAASQGGGTGRRAGRGGGRTRCRSGDQGDGRIDGQGGKVGGQGREANRVEVKGMVGIKMAMPPMTTSGVMLGMSLRTTTVGLYLGILGDKIICDLHKTPDLSQRSIQNCPKCGNPVDGHYCQGYALLRKKFKEDLFTSCVENGILQDSSEPSNDNTNVVNALQEPFVVNQDPGKNSSKSPPQINHHCYYGCSDPLEDVFCHQCTCELCGNGAHFSYNCPTKVPIILDSKPFNNQTIKELPQIVPSFDSTCYSEDGNSFTYDSTSNLVHDSFNVLTLL